MLRRLLAAPDVALDVGTATTRLAVAGSGRVFAAPSCDPLSGVHALRNGVVCSIEAAARVLRPLVQSQRGLRPLPPRALCGVPSDATAAEREALCSAARAAGAEPIALVAEPIAAAVGSGRDLADPRALLVVDVGDGVTDIALIRDREVVRSHAVRIGIADLRETALGAALVALRSPVSAQAAEFLVGQVGATRAGGNPELAVPGAGGRTLRAAFLRDALRPLLARLYAAVNAAFLGLPDRDAVEVIERRVLLTGGGALLSGLPPALAEVTGLDLSLAPDPLHAVVDGARAILETAGDRLFA
ncbi:MAG: rod shape-determining protein [Vicinamibacteria bacterium]|nr:rod shape-determining protein [Vicinamibacteria bacterium]